MKTETAWKALLHAQAERGSNCVDRSDKFSPPEDAYGHTPIPTASEARMLCFRCPLLGNECRDYRLSLGDKWAGVLDGMVNDSWGDQTTEYEGSYDD